ncbi:DUF3343 domain-containing protein [Alkaliphilus serpentinus]|uniref:DUF3343 domain-containing protein n=1 Tax=Alkaliphilus serpentinus TaxID=1482731 RepID=A0A833HQB7_9FIRM|nr:DUF3343 domain-containing protein [Alkaliphilus serpentinus]KAB3531773.1 DUF3343 domain-containing protein [Alkaliphilus serpentinus]
MHVIVFDSTHAAISAEKTLKELNIPIEIIPTPREITASCGLSILFDKSYMNLIKEEITKEKLSINGVYLLEKRGIEKHVDRIM